MNAKPSHWNAVLGRVSIGYVLGHLPFTPCLKELPSMVKSLVLCCADDVEIWQGVTRYADVCTLQANKDYPVGWSERWLVSIEATKCVYVYTEDAKINCYCTCLTLVTLDLFHENLNMIVNHDLRPGTT